MDLGSAMEAHTRWKVRLRDALEGNQALDPDHVACDGRCDLGNWIRERGQMDGSAAFVTLGSQHASFHKTVTEILDACRAGRVPVKRGLVAISSAISTHSSSVVSLLGELAGEVG